MELATAENVVLGSIAFIIFWVLAVFPAVPFLPIGRTAGSLLGAMLMIIFRVISPEQAFTAIDLSVLGLLFGTMVVSFYLETAGMFKYLGKLLSWRSHGPKDLLCRICLISAVSSALFTNDTCCVVLTEFILKTARQNGVSPHPFLLALASSANVGSSATPIGNPQNLVIAMQSRIPFGEFVLGIIPAMLVGVLVNCVILICMYWRSLSVKKDEENALSEVLFEREVTSHRFSPVAMSHPPSQALSAVSESMNVSGLSSPNENTDSSLKNRRRSLSESDICRVEVSEVEPKKKSVPLEELADGQAFSQLMEEMVANGGVLGRMDMKNDVEIGMRPQLTEEEKHVPKKRKHLPKKWKKLSWETCIYLVIIGMLISLLMGLNMSWTALTAALVLIILDFKDAGPCLDKVSYSLLIFFCGMFITVEGFNKTGIPSTLWTLMEPHARVNKVGGIAVLAIVILVLSNVASNVPTVLLLGARVAASAAAVSESEEKKAWLILAWVSTVAGNLSLLGSAANLIVCEQARRAKPVGYNLTFWTHLKFGFPSTLIITAVGLALIRG